MLFLKSPYNISIYIYILYIYIYVFNSSTSFKKQWLGWGWSKLESPSTPGWGGLDPGEQGKVEKMVPSFAAVEQPAVNQASWWFGT
jgi:hypothetical protein